MSQVHATPVLASFKTSATVTAYQIVKVSGANQVDVWDTTTAYMIGIAQQSARVANFLGTSVAVAIGGCAKLTAGASISAGAFVVGTTTGLGVEDASAGFINTATTTVPFGIGIALDAADTNSVMEVLLMPRNVRWTK